MWMCKLLRVRAITLALLIALATAVAACGSDDSGGSASTSGGSSGGGGAGAGTKIGIALTGPRNDRGFYQSAYEGMAAAGEQDGYEVSVVDNLEEPQARLDALKNLAADNKLVVGGGAEFIDAARTLVSQFPDVQFVILTGVAEPGTANLHAYVPRQGVPAYIAGAVAATVSRTNHVGFVGGLEIPPTTASNLAFKQGAQDTEAGEQYSTTTVGTFNDPAKAKQAAAAQIASGADSLFAFLDAGTPGVVQALDESGKEGTLFAAIAPRCDESPKFVGTAVLDVSKLVEVMVEDFQADALPDGTKFYGVDVPEIQRFELCPKYRTPELTKLVDELTRKLDSDAITLPRGV
jgi:basic membrane protein A